MTWSNGRQLSTIDMGEGQAVNFLYNAGGQRMVKVGNSRSVLYQIIDGVAVGESINNGQTVIYYLFDEKGDVYGLNVNGSEYFLRKNLQGDVIGIWEDEGPQVVSYTYDPWGKLLSMTDSTNIGVGTLNPFRYRSYYYDIETGLYYLQSRYYDPETGRFVNGDGQLNTGDFLGLNQFTYCNNNPVLLEDSSGTRPIASMTVARETTIDRAISCAFRAGRPFALAPIVYDVPHYDQEKDGHLCWASCQTMLEDYQAGKHRTPEEAKARAIEIAKSKFGEDRWNQRGFPTNASKQVIKINTIYDLYNALTDYGPVYAAYKEAGKDVGHLVVVTGVDVSQRIVYINDPNWDQSGTQRFSSFRTCSYSSEMNKLIYGCGDDLTFVGCYSIGP